MDFGNKPFSLIHYLSVKSAAMVNRPDEILFWYCHEPQGQLWELARKLVTPRKIQAPESIFGRPLRHPAHRSDVVRLEKLLEYGGIYLDCDVLCVRPMSELRSSPFVMAWQERRGLCNATMMSEPNAAFGRRWLDTYAGFRSSGRDWYWDEHSVIVPSRLARRMPQHIRVLPSEAFFIPSFQEIPTFLEQDLGLADRAYSVHLWETIWWPLLTAITVKGIRNGQSEFARLARPFVIDLPE